MTISVKAMALIFAVVPFGAHAQWPNYLAVGNVDLAAPAPKMADGKPDFSGIWDRGTAPAPAGARLDPNPIGVSGAPPPPGARPFQNLPSLFPDGLPFQPWAAELRKQRLAQNSKDHPDAHCLPIHPVQLHSHPQPRKIIQTPGLVLIIYEANNGLRQIFTDGRPLPNADAEPWWFGYSGGKWDGDTLVVETIGFRDNMWLDEEGTPITSAGRITERFRRPNFGTLEIEVTVDDPKTFTRPWRAKLTQRLMPNTELIEFVCQENNTSVQHLVGK
jgi:hypothetical protein